MYLRHICGERERAFEAKRERSAPASAVANDARREVTKRRSERRKVKELKAHCRRARQSS